VAGETGETALLQVYPSRVVPGPAQVILERRISRDERGDRCSLRGPELPYRSRGSGRGVGGGCRSIPQCGCSRSRPHGPTKLISSPRVDQLIGHVGEGIVALVQRVPEGKAAELAARTPRDVLAGRGRQRWDF